MEGGPGSGLSQELGCRAREKPAACGAGDRGPEVTRPGCCRLQRGRGIGAWCWGPARAPGFLPHGAEWKRRRALWRAARELQIKGKADSEEAAPRSSQGVQVERAKPGPRTSPSSQTPRRLPRTLVRQEHHSSSRPQTAHLQSLAPTNAEADDHKGPHVASPAGGAGQSPSKPFRLPGSVLA